MEFKTIYTGLSFIKDISVEIEETADLQFFAKRLANTNFCEIGFDDEWCIEDEELKNLLVGKVKTGSFTISAKWVLDKRNLTEIIRVLSIINDSLEETEV